MKILPVVLSGGSGSRLWPLSREQYPKQLLAFGGENTLLQETLLRLDGLGPALEAPMVVCNEAHRFLVAEQLRAIDHTASAIILEPMGRNTAPALTVAAMLRLQQHDDAVLLVLPADHVVRLSEPFHAAIAEAVVLAESGALVTFGIVPTHGETGYGYIRKGETLPGGNGAAEIAAFVEKPDKTTADAYVASGEYLWNSGMFVMKASVWLAQVAAHQPVMAEACQRAVDGRHGDLDFCRLDHDAFADCPSESIDYAVMEKLGQSGEGATKGVVVPLDAGWSDLGAWPAIWEVCERDDSGNTTRGDVLTHESRDCLIHAEHRLVAGVGLDDLLVVETADAVLVANKSHAQDVKKIVEQLKRSKRPETLAHRQVSRPWGTYEGVDAGERFQVKRIVVKPGAKLSLQMHHHRAEHWIVVKGTANVTCGEKTFLLTENQSTYIPIGEKHRLENPGTVPLEIIEVQSGSYLGEDDIVRFDDQYGRSD